MKPNDHNLCRHREIATGCVLLVLVILILPHADGMLRLFFKLFH